MDAVPNPDKMPGQDCENLCETPLQAAAYKGDIERLRELIKAGSDVNAVCGFFGTALQAACYGGQIETSRVLLKRGANANSTSSFHGNPIHTAARDGNAELIDLLHEFRAEIDAKGGVYGNALIAAAKGGHLAAVELLTIQGAKLNEEGRSEEYPTALYAASLNGHREVVARLLLWGADVNREYAHGKTALRAAVEGGYHEIVALLMGNDASLAQKCENGLNVGELTLHMAVKGGHMDLVYCLLTFSYIDVNLPNEEGLSPLLIAVSHGHTDIVRHLLNNGRKSIDTTARDASGSTALMIAVSHGYEDVVRVILEYGKSKGDHDIYSQDFHSLMMAVSGGNQGIVLLLLERGVDAWEPVGPWRPYANGQRKTPLITAIEIGQEAITFLLLQHVAKIEDADGSGNKPMDVAISKGNRTIEKLLSFGGGKAAIADRDPWWKSVSRVSDEWN